MVDFRRSAAERDLLVRRLSCRREPPLDLHWSSPRLELFWGRVMKYCGHAMFSVERRKGYGPRWYSEPTRQTHDTVRCGALLLRLASAPVALSRLIPRRHRGLLCGEGALGPVGRRPWRSNYDNSEAGVHEHLWGGRWQRILNVIGARFRCWGCGSVARYPAGPVGFCAASAACERIGHTRDMPSISPGRQHYANSNPGWLWQFCRAGRTMDRAPPRMS